KTENTPTSFVRNVLSESECPVIIPPLDFEPIEEIILTCSETRSSVFAIRQFRYLFPQLNDKKVTVVEVERDLSHPESVNPNFRQWIKDHYPAALFVVLKGNTNEVLEEYLSSKRNAIIVVSACTRNILSQAFVPSLIDSLIGKIHQPFFIAHN
ncbi:MAG: hypothetical protein ABI581_18015, partial [Sediminibacterium sp.]